MESPGSQWTCGYAGCLTLKTMQIPGTKPGPDGAQEAESSIWPVCSDPPTLSSKVRVCVWGGGCSGPGCASVSSSVKWGEIL